MKKCLTLLVFSLMVFSTTINAQSNVLEIEKEDEKDYLAAEDFFDDGKYLQAIPYYQKLEKKYPNKSYLNYKIGICYLYRIVDIDKSVEKLEAAYKKDKELEDVTFYLGKAYLLSSKFDQSKVMMKKFLADPIDSKKIPLAERIIQNCDNAKTMLNDTIPAGIQNLGDPINTTNSEYVPVISADESVLIYTYLGERSKGGLQNNKHKPDPEGDYYEDIFISFKVGSHWLDAESIGDNINSTGNDAPIALSPDGQKLFIFKSTLKDKGDIYMSMLDGNTWSVPVSLNSNINTNMWEGSVTLSSDERTLYFASERKGGFGGRDLYRSVLQSDGTWGKAENLGPTINTPNNEDAPFIHPDGKSFYFSSEGHNSIGGYDIFKTKLSDDGIWSKPKNLGLPLNTPGDDKYYVISADGLTGYYSSGKVGGFGQQDIYTVTPGVFDEKPVLALIKGVVFMDDQPGKANIIVSNADNGDVVGNFSSNSSSGKYLLALPPGKNYKVAFEIEGAKSHIEYVNIKSLDRFVETIQDFHLYSENFAQEKIANADSTNILDSRVREEVKKIQMREILAQQKDSVYRNILKNNGYEKKKDVGFFIVLCDLKNNEKLLNSYETDSVKIVASEIANGGTRYSAGPFGTILEAEMFKNNLFHKDSVCAKNSKININDKGEFKDIQQYYNKYYNDTNKVIVADNPNKQVDNGKDLTTALKNIADKPIEGLSVKLEIGAYKDEKEFKLDKLNEFGKIEKKKYDDGITRFTIGPFKTVAEAEALREKVLAKYPEAKDIFTMVFSLEKPSYPRTTPCDSMPFFDYVAYFDGKDLNDPFVYDGLVQRAGNYCHGDLIFKVQIGAYRHPENFKYPNLQEFGSAEIKEYPDGITRFTMREFKTLGEAEVFRQEVIKKGTWDAWITAMYKGQRMILTDLIKVNFYNQKVN